MSDAKNNLIWLDMEMTGLEPDTCVPIEVALVVTNADLVELDTMESIIWQPESTLELMTPFVRDMHTKNGVLKKVRSARASMANVEKTMLTFLARWFSPGEAVLCGNSIHQDRRFIRKYFPAVDRFLHYRMVDVSTLKELARRWYGSEVLMAKSASDHTALADVRESIRELTHYRATILRSNES